MDMPAKMRGLYCAREMGCSYSELFSGFSSPAPIGEKRKRNVAGDGPGGCRETV